MDRDVMEGLRFDVRLRRRRGWVDDAEFDAHVEDLADVSDKAVPLAALAGDESDEASTASSAEGSPASE